MKISRFLAIPLLVAALCGCVSFSEDPAAEGGSNLARHRGEIQLASTSLASLPRPATASLLQDRFVTADGTELPLRSWLPAGEPRAVILALHGFNDYSHAFALPAPGLAAQGIAVYAYDQRCFGAAPQRGHWAGERAMTQDAILAARLLHQRYPGTPLYFLGESMGGAVAILAATAVGPAPVDGLILSAPAVWGRQRMNVFERVGLWVARLLPSMRVSGRSVPYHVHPSDNIPMLRALGADPLVIKETRTDALNGLVDLMSDALAAAPKLRTPALILYGARDDIVPRQAFTAFLEALPRTSQERVAIYPEGYHLLLRDLEAATVLGDVAAWINAPHSNLPSGADMPVGRNVRASAS